MQEAGFGTRFALASLATWRVAHLLAEEDGPADLVVRVRARLGDSVAGELMDCFYCLSVWVAVPLGLTLTRRARELPVMCLALSGTACLLERVTKEREEYAATSLEQPAHPPISSAAWGQSETA